MERYYVGLDVSKEKTAICVRASAGSMVMACETRTDPDAIFAALVPFRDWLERVILETGRMANWLYDELTRRGLPAVCVDARQAHAVLGQMHNSEADQRMIRGIIRPPNGCQRRSYAGGSRSDGLIPKGRG